MEKYNIPVVWPVIKEYEYIKDYIKNGITFINENDDFEYKQIYLTENRIKDDENLLFIPLHGDYRHPNMDGKIYQNKYKCVGLSYSDWVDFFTFERNKEKEDHLFYNILKLKDGENYNLINRMYGSPPNSIIANFDFPKDIKYVELDYHNGITVFDWCKVLENADNIYTVDTCYILLAEKLNLKCEKLNIFSRRPGNWSEIDYMLNKSFNKLV